MNINFKKILLSKFSSNNKKKISRSNFGINVAGPFKGMLGLGTATRNYAIAIRNKKIPHVLNTVTTGKKDKDTYIEHFDNKNPHPINLLVFNADPSKWMYKKLGTEYFKNKYNIGIWFWELSNFPEKWIDRFQYYNEIWVASSFMANSISKYSPIPVKRITCPVEVDERKFVKNKEKFGVKKDNFVFLFIFDFNSVFERKNPVGIIDAFNHAFNENENAVLIIKTINGNKYPEESKILANKCERKNILLLNERMNNEKLMSLYASSDCYVSLHRSEGVGFSLAEAMLAKKPVIATPYGGNTDFMNENNSFLVKYDLIRLTSDHGLYEKGNVWANPNLFHATSLMRYVYENPEATKKIAEKGYQTIKNQMSFEKSGNEILERMKTIYQNEIN